jgi:predicted homoserine dehydrogenase-like protein
MLEAAQLECVRGSRTLFSGVGLRREPTGAPTGFRGDVVAIAKRNLKTGETLDGEGGYAVRGKLMAAQDSLARGGLPIGLAHGVKLARAVKKDALVTWRDVAAADTDAARFRRQMEAEFSAEWSIGSAAMANAAP